MAKKSEKYAYLNRLTTEQLEELLRADFESPEPGDEDAVFHILEVMERREREAPTGRLPEGERAWEEFQRYYSVPEGEDRSLYPWAGEETQGEGEPAEDRTPCGARRQGMRRWFRQGLVAAVTAAALLGGMVVAQAAGLDVFGAIGRWTEDVFHFEPAYTGQAREADTSVREIFAENGIDENLAPTWFPEGFEVVATDVITTEISCTINVALSNEDSQTILIIVQKYAQYDYVENYLFEKDGIGVEIYTNNEMDFYILGNVEVITATWAEGLMMEQISGNISLDDIKMVVDSIGDAKT